MTECVSVNGEAFLVRIFRQKIKQELLRLDAY